MDQAQGLRKLMGSQPPLWWAQRGDHLLKERVIESWQILHPEIEVNSLNARTIAIIGPDLESTSEKISFQEFSEKIAVIVNGVTSAHEARALYDEFKRKVFAERSESEFSYLGHVPVQETLINLKKGAVPSHLKMVCNRLREWAQ